MQPAISVLPGFVPTEMKIRRNRIMGSIQRIYHAAIYARISKEDGGSAAAGKKESNSISNQKSLIRDFLKDKEDIEIVSERVDDGYSGSSFARVR